MENLLIINASPRGPRSNTKIYTDFIPRYFQGKITEHFVAKQDTHAEIISAMTSHREILLALPLYTDGLPACLLEFLRKFSEGKPEAHARLHVMINCGFYEPEQNDIAVAIIRLFCKRHGFTMGSVLKIGSGEGFPSTPFLSRVRRTVKNFCRHLETENREFDVTMPISATTFVKAANKFWIKRAKHNRVDISTLSDPLS